MGDRTFSYYPCSVDSCLGQVEEYDAPSSCLFVAICDTCGWKDPKHYVDTGYCLRFCYCEDGKHNEAFLEDLVEALESGHPFNEDLSKTVVDTLNSYRWYKQCREAELMREEDERS